jgi:hypothetical protein
VGGWGCGSEGRGRRGARLRHIRWHRRVRGRQSRHQRLSRRKRRCMGRPKGRRACVGATGRLPSSFLKGQHAAAQDGAKQYAEHDRSNCDLLPQARLFRRTLRLATQCLSFQSHAASVTYNWHVRATGKATSRSPLHTSIPFQSDRNSQVECSAHAHFTFDPNTALVCFDQRFDDRQAYARLAEASDQSVASTIPTLKDT